MSTALSPDEFYATGDLSDWSFIPDGVLAVYATGDFNAGVRFVEKIAELADAANHHPDITLTYPIVSIRLISHDVGWVTQRDVDLALKISALAADLGIASDPEQVQGVQIAVDGFRDGSHAFWKAALGYQDRGSEDLTDPRGRGPALWFQSLTEERDAPPRLHLDVILPPSQTRQRVADAVAAGGEIVRDDSPRFVTIQSPDGNLVDIATGHPGAGWD